jgi:predicted amidohydrolase
MKLYCCQYPIAWEDKAGNFDKIRALLQSTQLERGSLLLLPEMFSTGFSMNVAAIHEGENSPATNFLREIARELGIYVVGGVVTKNESGIGSNEALAISPDGELLARYTKIHPFTPSGELKHYARGKEIVSFEWNHLKVVPFICYDLRFPEIFRSAVKQGAELFLVIANWPNKRERHWTTLLEARAIENLAYVAGANRNGSDPQHEYPGRSMIFDPHGKVVADAGSAEGIICAEIYPDAVKQWRAEFPALKDQHWNG